jgi:hypothetical protein
MQAVIFPASPLPTQFTAKRPAIFDAVAASVVGIEDCKMDYKTAKTRRWAATATGRKTCFKCGVDQPTTEFYRHPQMSDGFLGKCKVCTKKDVTQTRDSQLDKIRAYDRARGNRQSDEWRQRYRLEHPVETAARRAVGNAVRDGRLTKGPCEVCGSVVGIHAHHDDYSHALDVRWLCVKHHRQHHLGRRID